MNITFRRNARCWKQEGFNHPELHGTSSHFIELHRSYRCAHRKYYCSHAAPGDAAHSEYAGIAKQAQYVLFEAILTDAAATDYCAELRSFPFPSGWGRLQYPKHHLSSYRMQECGRLSIVCPLLLRTWLQPHFVNPLYLRVMEVTVSPALNLPPIDAIVYCYAMMAKSNTILLSQFISKNDRENITEILLQSRKSFQRLFECAAIAAPPLVPRSTNLPTALQTPKNASNQSRMLRMVTTIDSDSSAP